MSNEITKSSEQARDRQSLFNFSSSHNNFPAIESLNPIDIGTEKQFRFTAKMLETMFDVSINTIKNRIEALVNVGDLSCQNFDKTNLPDSRGRLTTHNVKEIIMGNLVIKNDSFIQSMHNDIQCIESLDPNDKGTSRQYWFTASMLANIFDITDKTARNNIDFLEKWGEVTMGKNLLIVQTQNSAGAVKDTAIYDLHVFNKLAMQLRTDAAMEIRSKFSDILVEIETTGQYNVKDMPKSLPEALRAYADAIEAKEQAAKECERQRLIAEEAIKRRAQIGTKREATAMNTASRLSKENTKLKDELADTIEKLDQANVDNDILKTQLEITKSSMFTNKRVCEMLRDRFEITWADSTLKSKTSKALQSIANEFGENIIYDKQFVEGVLRKVPYYTQHTADILIQRLEYDCAYLRQF